MANRSKIHRIDIADGDVHKQQPVNSHGEANLVELLKLLVVVDRFYSGNPVVFLVVQSV